MLRSSQIYLSAKLINSKSFRLLTKTEIRVYFEFLLKNTSQEGDSYAFSITEAKTLGISQPTFFRAIEKLIKVGLIDSIAKDDIDGFSLYSLSKRWKKYGTLEFIKKARLPSQQGYVYLIKSQQVYKIGIAKNIKTRFAKYITENPFPVEMILSYKVEDYLNKEKYLLNRFIEKKLHGEWFSLNKIDIDMIDNYLQECYP